MYTELLRGEPSDRRYNTIKRKIAAPMLPPTIAAVLGEEEDSGDGKKETKCH